MGEQRSNSFAPNYSVSHSPDFKISSFPCSPRGVLPSGVGEPAVRLAFPLPLEKNFKCKEVGLQRSVLKALMGGTQRREGREGVVRGWDLSSRQNVGPLSLEV